MERKSKRPRASVSLLNLLPFDERTEGVCKGVRLGLRVSYLVNAKAFIPQLFFNRFLAGK